MKNKNVYTYSYPPSLVLSHSKQTLCILSQFINGQIINGKDGTLGPVSINLIIPLPLKVSHFKVTSRASGVLDLPNMTVIQQNLKI